MMEAVFHVPAKRREAAADASRSSHKSPCDSCEKKEGLQKPAPLRNPRPKGPQDAAVILRVRPSYAAT